MRLFLLLRYPLKFNLCTIREFFFVLIVCNTLNANAAEDYISISLPIAKETVPFLDQLLTQPAYSILILKNIGLPLSFSQKPQIESPTSFKLNKYKLIFKNQQKNIYFYDVVLVSDSGVHFTVPVELDARNLKLYGLQIRATLPYPNLIPSKIIHLVESKLRSLSSPEAQTHLVAYLNSRREQSSTIEAQRRENERRVAQITEETRRIEEERRQIALERQRVESQKVQAQTPPDNRRRLALVIGNDNYSSMPRLNNAVNDAKSMSDALKQANFEVISLSNLDKRRMEEALRNFTGKLGRDDVGLFYFSGHGIQADNRNFLIPVAENVKKTSEVPYEGIDVNRVMDNLKDAKNALNIVVLDACRSSLPDARGGMSRGLTVTDAPQGSIIAYATSPGKTASDGDGGNSPYTKNLIRAMQRKGVKIEDVFKEVRQSVIRETNGEQTPSETSYLVGDFYFRP